MKYLLISASFLLGLYVIGLVICLIFMFFTLPDSSFNFSRNYVAAPVIIAIIYRLQKIGKSNEKE